MRDLIDRPIAVEPRSVSSVSFTDAMDATIDRRRPFKFVEFVHIHLNLLGADCPAPLRRPDWEEHLEALSWAAHAGSERLRREWAQLTWLSHKARPRCSAFTAESLRRVDGIVERAALPPTMLQGVKEVMLAWDGQLQALLSVWHKTMACHGIDNPPSETPVSPSDFVSSVLPFAQELRLRSPRPDLARRLQGAAANQRRRRKNLLDEIAAQGY